MTAQQRGTPISRFLAHRSGGLIDNHGRRITYKKATGDCIMPREGVFARVIQGGEAKAGDPIAL